MNQPTPASRARTTMSFLHKRPRPATTKSGAFLRWTRRMFLAVGVLLSSYVCLVIADAQLYQTYQSWRFQRELNGLHLSLIKGRTRSPGEVSAAAGHIKNLGMTGHEGSPLGRIEIDAVGVDVMILEGIEEGTLRHAVGHIPGTSLPGQEGNFAIAGHRDTFFRPLRNIHKDDVITLTTLQGSYRYRVDYTKIVQPEEVSVLDDSDGAILTLITCYPFYFLGAAPQRFIVRAHKV